MTTQDFNVLSDETRALLAKRDGDELRRMRRERKRAAKGGYCPDFDMPKRGFGDSDSGDFTNPDGTPMKGNALRAAMGYDEFRRATDPNGGNLVGRKVNTTPRLTDEGLPEWALERTYDLVREQFREQLIAGTLTRKSLGEILGEQGKAGQAQNAYRKDRPRQKAQPIPGTEHLDSKQKARLACLRQRLRESEAALKHYVENGHPTGTVQIAENWVKTRTDSLHAAMRQMGVPVPEQE